VIASGVVFQIGVIEMKFFIRKLNVGVFTRPRPISAMRGSDLLRRKLTFEPCISGRKFLI